MVAGLSSSSRCRLLEFVGLEHAYATRLQLRSQSLSHGVLNCIVIASIEIKAISPIIGEVCQVNRCIRLPQRATRVISTRFGSL